MVARRGASVELLNYRSALFGFVTFPTKRNRRLSEKSRDLPHSLFYVDSPARAVDYLRLAAITALFVLHV